MPPMTKQLQTWWLKPVVYENVFHSILDPGFMLMNT